MVHVGQYSFPSD